MAATLGGSRWGDLREGDSADDNGASCNGTEVATVALFRHGLFGVGIQTDLPWIWVGVGVDLFAIFVLKYMRRHGY